MLLFVLYILIVIYINKYTPNNGLDTNIYNTYTTNCAIIYTSSSTITPCSYTYI